jgi:hypothetical protein
MKTQTKILGLVSFAALGLAIACGSDSDTGTPPPGAGGSAGSGTAGSAGKANGGTGGSAAGTSGNGTGGSTAGTGGSTAGTGGSTAGTAGTSGGGAGGSTAGTSGTSGEGGEAGATNVPDILYDFEVDNQKWADGDTGVTVAISTDQAVTGTHSLKVSVPALVNTVSGACPAGMLCQTTVNVSQPDVAPVGAGAVLTFHVWTPAGTDGLYVQAFSQENGFKFDAAGNSAKTLVRGGWTTWTYTVPKIFPGGIEQIGLQMGIGDTGTGFAGGDFYIDSITVTGGDVSCSGAGTGNYDFETPADVSAWKVDTVAGAAPTDTAIAQSTTEFKTGANSLKVSFTALPMATDANTPTQRNVFVDWPNAFCGQTIMFNVWSPTGSDNLNFRAYGQTGWFAGFPTSAATTITRGDWTTISFTLPATINPLGLQRIGVQFENKDTAAPFTGDLYIDAVTWP